MSIFEYPAFCKTNFMKVISGFGKALALCVFLLNIPCNIYASHIVGADLTYTHVSGNTYKVTVTLFGDCGPGAAGSFATLASSSPRVCIYDGGTVVGSLDLSITIPTTGVEVTPLCTGDISQCTSPSSVIPGIKKFVYSGTYTLPHTSATWRFIYEGYNGGGAAAGRSGSITNITGGTLIQLIDTLNNTVYNNTSPLLSDVESSFFCLNQYDNYSPLATDPDGDSLVFRLAPATNGSGGGTCSLPGPAVGYIGTAWTGMPVSGSTPLSVLAGSFSFNNGTGQLTFNPNVIQKSVIVYNVREYRAGVLVGVCQREMTFSVVICPVGSMCTGMPYPGTASVNIGCAGAADALSLSGYSCGVTFQWQYSTDTTLWTNLPGAITASYTYTPTFSRYYRCAVQCPSSGLTAYSANVFFPVHSATGLHCIIDEPDTICHMPDFYTATCSLSPVYNVTTWYGDGTSDNTPLTTVYPCHADVYHNYSFPGIYSIRQVLYDGAIPVDSTSFFYHYPYCRILPFELYYDNNYDCAKGTNELLLLVPSRFQVDSNGVTIDTVSAVSGFYYMAYGPPGTVYGFKLISTFPGISVSCPSSGIIYDTIQAVLNDYPVKSFGYHCTSIPSFDLGVHVTGTAGGHATRSYITVENKLCTPQPAALIMYFNPKYTYENSTPSATSFTHSTATWNIDPLSSIFAPFKISVRGHTTSTVEYVPGDTVQTRFVVIPTTGDADSTDNIIIRTDTVRVGCDPNYMEVDPAGYITSGTQLQYVIQFENTGNDTAFNIHVMDTLSDYLDATSLTMLAVSAEMKISMLNIGGKNIVKFDFPNINLLDSSHHGFSEGMLMYKINTRAGLADSTIISNRAGIYFDYNVPVLTNTVQNVICDACVPNGLAQVERSVATLFPNPANNELIIKTAPGAYHSYTITNTMGQVLMGKEILEQQTKVDIWSLPAGLYYITLKGESGTAVRKFIKI